MQQLSHFEGQVLSGTQQRKKLGGKIGKKELDVFYMRIYREHGKGGDNLGRVQCCGGTSAAGHPQLSGDAGEVGQRDRGRNGDGAAVGFEAPESFERYRLGGGPEGWSADALQGECCGDPAVARMDEYVRAAVETPAAANQGTGRGQEYTFTYNLQELAFFSWFYGAPTLGLNGWFSNNGTFLTDAGPPCT
jgi:hypothetical protein